jgi:hypothetical protein
LLLLLIFASTSCMQYMTSNLSQCEWSELRIESLASPIDGLQFRKPFF